MCRTDLVNIPEGLQRDKDAFGKDKLSELTYIYKFGSSLFFPPLLKSHYGSLQSGGRTNESKNVDGRGNVREHPQECVCIYMLRDKGNREVGDTSRLFEELERCLTLRPTGENS